MMQDIIFKNHNRAIIKKIVKRELHYNVKRNFFIVAAIILTSFMLASVFSVGMSYMKSVNMQQMRLKGTISHMTFKEPTQEQLEILPTLKYIDQIGLTYIVGETEDVSKLENLILAHVNRAQWEEMLMPTFVDIEGKFAENENEIMLSRYILDAMGIDNPKIGMEIPIRFAVYGTDEIVTENFVLSGIYTEFSHTRPGSTVAIYTSLALAKKYGVATLDNTTVNLIFRDSRKVKEYVERLKKDLDFEESQRYTQFSVFENKVNVATYTVIGSLVILLIFTGYLLIYNVMHISVSRDVRFYGMLKTLGASPTQIKNIIQGQLSILCVIGLPIGMLAATFISLVVVPVIVSNGGVRIGKAIVSFSPIIYLSTMVFTAVTIYLGAASPVRKAAHISPIEASKYEGGWTIKKSYPFSTNGKSVNMALRNIFRDKKRALVVIISLFMGVMVFTSILTVIISWDIERRLELEYDHDFSITSAGISSPYLERDFLDMVSKLDGVKEVRIRTLELGRALYSDVLDDYIESLYERVAHENAGWENFSKQDMIDIFRESGLELGLRGIEVEELKDLSARHHVVYDFEAFEQGKIAIINNQGIDLKIRDSSFPIGSVLDIMIGTRSYQMEVGGHMDLYSPQTGFIVSNGIEIIVSSTFLQQIFKEPNITSVGIDVADGYEERIYHILDNMLSSDKKMISRYTTRQEMKENQTIMYALGGSISGILALIGVFNFINVISVGVIDRKREIATLESIGMSKNQTIRMLRYEGIGYGVITILASLSAGNLITVLLFLLFKKVEPTAQFTYPVVQIMIVYAIILFICAIVPEVAYKNMSKATLTERMREAE